MNIDQGALINVPLRRKEIIHSREKNLRSFQDVRKYPSFYREENDRKTRVSFDLPLKYFFSLSLFFSISFPLTISFHPRELFIHLLFSSHTYAHTYIHTLSFSLFFSSNLTNWTTASRCKRSRFYPRGIEIRFISSFISFPFSYVYRYKSGYVYVRLYL